MNKYQEGYKDVLVTMALHPCHTFPPVRGCMAMTFCNSDLYPSFAEKRNYSLIIRRHGAEVGGLLFQRGNACSLKREDNDEGREKKEINFRGSLQQ